MSINNNVENLEKTENKLENFFKKIVDFSPREIAILSALASLSILNQFVHIGYMDPVSYIWIDIVGVFWVMAFFLYGLRGYFVTSFLGVLVISLFDQTGVVGGLMKFFAVTSAVLGFYLILKIFKKKASSVQNSLHLTLAITTSLATKILIMVPLYYYFAWPIYTGTSSEIGFQSVPIVLVAGLNLAGGLVDIVLAWVLAFVYKVKKFGKDEE
jgi:riboflavin transporter FmnP